MPTCNSKDCQKPAHYGYKGKIAINCHAHKETNMLYFRKYNCAEPGCNKTGSFAHNKSDQQRFCDSYKEFAMSIVMSKKCVKCGLTRPSFNISGKKPEYCENCKEKNMINVDKEKCIICKKVQATFGFPDCKPQYCSKDRPEGTITKDKKECIEPGCTTGATYNFKNMAKPIYCVKHAKYQMINVANRKCQYPGCDTSASYGLNNKKDFCAQHKDDKMLLLKSSLCKHEGCTEIAQYGVEGKRTHCCSHKNDSMILKSNRRCTICQKIATFNIKGEPPKFCSSHATTQMIDVTLKRCDECDLRARYGLPGQKPTKCNDHKLNMQILNPLKRCTEPNCKEIALYGIVSQIHCEKHRLQSENNLIEKPCISCKLLMILDNENICKYCDPTTFKTVRLAKQTEIKSLLDTYKFKYIIYDKLIDSKCGLERPDFVFDCLSYSVILEIDEHQHRQYKNQTTLTKNDTNYDCETTRMINISQAIGQKTIFIRYNPDNYRVNGIIQKPSDGERHKTLLHCLKAMTKQKYNNIPFLSVIYLFYDEYNKTDCKLEEIKLLI